MSGRRTRQRGQGAVELLVAIPCIVAAALLAWQLALVGAAVRDAEDAARLQALTVTGAAGATATVSAEIPVDGPFGGGMVAGADAVVVLP